MSASTDQTFDVVVIGAGAVGENTAERAGRTGLSVAVVEDALVGGECSYWACMPSKALLRPGAALAAARGVPGVAEMLTGELDPAPVLARRDTFTSHWHDDSQVSWLEGAGITLIRGRARFTGPRTMTVTAPADGDGSPLTTTVTARHAVILATGSTPVVPAIDGLDPSEVWTSREATSVTDVPASLAIVGGGVVAVEMATALTDLGTRVTVVARGDRLLTSSEPFAGEAVAAALTDLGVDIRLGTEVTRATATGETGTRTATRLHLSDGSTVVVEKVLVATGRRPATTDIGLDAVGLDPEKPLAVDDAMEVLVEPDGAGTGWLFAAGDVTGRAATTHQGKYEGRVAGDVVAARFGPEGARGPGPGGPDAPDARTRERSAARWSQFRASADHRAVPQVVFTRPEVSSVGLTEQQARDAGLAIRTIRYDLASVAGASLVSDDYAGTAQLIVTTDTRVIVGATFVGPDAAELLHAATIAVVGEVPLDRLWHAVPAYPTVSEVWLRLLEEAGL
ncbi:dihydrolipoamide dehydrogenase [Sanguibacter gelidistatuariae]|uniref:Dihydrolipoamide dehydrogenase n=1 Tax=Sanguibacter gelidistatuariae TaxID=1814289 RepID=A0A1G6H5L9_9MICO|nr:NAD(P)/FAD-dependent oxidoreductase [Sanguibacter gelidistatuariae]SDB89433.1 dihydrolipoamide dehydrogenase [Sanguibacter gelidistatuariae]